MVLERPALRDALEFARAGDTVVVWKLDRLRFAASGLPKEGVVRARDAALPRPRSDLREARRRSVSDMVYRRTC